MLDRFFPVLVGNRTEIIALAVTVLQFLAIFGVVDPQQANDATKVLGGAGMATLAAKLGR